METIHLAMCFLDSVINGFRYVSLSAGSASVCAVQAWLKTYRLSLKSRGANCTGAVNPASCGK
eukprot:240489-Amorphochlora_amoeboformis.AAC.1